MNWNLSLTSADQRTVYLARHEAFKNGDMPTAESPASSAPVESVVLGNQNFGSTPRVVAGLPAEPTQNHAATGESVKVTRVSAYSSAPILQTQEPETLPELTVQAVSGETETPGFVKSLSSHPEGPQWKSVWTQQTESSPGVVSVPFAFPGDHEGKLELCDADLHYRGLVALGAGETARGTLENWLDLGQRFTALPGRNRLNELGRSGMPRLSGVLLEEAERSGDAGFLQDAYKVVGDDHQQNWSDTYFKATSNGLTRFCDVDYSYEATLDESGGKLNSARFSGNPMPFNPIDLNAHLFATERDLATMADKLAAQSGGSPQDLAKYRAQASEWRTKAEARKALILEKLWDDKDGLFRDIESKDGSQSPVVTMATYSVLEAGLLDTDIPGERQMVERLVQGLDRFNVDGSLVWDLKSKQPAPASELVRISAGLKAYGFETQAMALKNAAKAQLFFSPPQSAGELSTAAILGQSPKLYDGQQPMGLSPIAQQRAEQIAAASGQPSAIQIVPGQGREIDKTLRRFDNSLLDSAVLNSLLQKRLGPSVLGLEVSGGSIGLKEAPQAPSINAPGGQVKVGALCLQTGLPEVKVGSLGDGAVTIARNGVTLAVVDLGDKIVIGDKVYPAELLASNGSSLPRLLTSFHTAGGNPTLEAFMHKNREWISVETSPGSTPGALASRPEWNRLYDKTKAGWKALTIDPSVVAHDTATQYFNPAAVPSLGIFKTQFNWDTEFMAMGMQKQGQNALVSDMTDNLLYLLKSTGRVPNAARSVYLNKSQPPFLPDLVKRSTAEREQRFGVEATREWRSEAYKLMSNDFHGFWREEGQRKAPDIGGKNRYLSRWGGDNHKFAMDESGFDTTSRFDGKTKDLVPPDLNAFLYKYAGDMAAIAHGLAEDAQKDGNIQEMLKYTSESALWKNEAQEIKKDLIELCWDEEDGMFRDFRYQGEPAGLQKDCDALSAVVAPLWAGVLDPNDPTEARMLERSLDNISSRFEKEHGLAATAEDYGHPEMQWNGPSGWAPLMMMAVDAEKRYGRTEEAARHTAKWLDNLAGVNEKDGMIIERYDVVKGGHPPIQKGRYEETQGEGPGFGWTNASVPWAMIEVFAGADTVRNAGEKPRLEIKPCLPASLHGQKVAVDYEVPGTPETCSFAHLYDPAKKSYQFEFQGQLDKLPSLELTTPPMEPGMMPQMNDDMPPFTIETTRKNGKDVHKIRFDQAPGQRSLKVVFGPT